MPLDTVRSIGTTFADEADASDVRRQILTISKNLKEGLLDQALDKIASVFDRNLSLSDTNIQKLSRLAADALNKIYDIDFAAFQEWLRRLRMRGARLNMQTPTVPI